MKKVATIAAAGGVIQIVALFLPLHFQRPGAFGTAFPPGYPLRFELGFAIAAFTPTILFTGGLILLLLRERRMASGVLLAAGTVVLLKSLVGPLYSDAGSRSRSLVLMSVELVAAILLLDAGWVAARPVTTDLPPPPLGSSN